MIAEKILNEIKSWKMIVTLYPFPGMKFQLMIMIARYYHNSDWIFWGWTMIELPIFAPQKSNTAHFEGLGVTKISEAAPVQVIPECSVCLDKVSNAVMVPCGCCEFCYDCANIHFFNENPDMPGKPTCPLCREEIKQVVKLHGR